MAKYMTREEFLELFSARMEAVGIRLQHIEEILSTNYGREQKLR